VSQATERIPAALLLEAYRKGRFPMSHGREGIFLHDPDPRAIFPLADLKPNARLQRAMRSAGFRVTFDQRFEDVMRACAERAETWITEEMIAAYVALHGKGHAHSVEVWQDGTLVGGLYGVSVGTAFFGESMFSRVTNASKAAFHHLAEHLRQQGFTLFDSQYINDHTASLGAIEVPRALFRTMLAQALAHDADF
jgi:leucyl/phenylalanyl-tRNA---protein transferase